MTKKRTNTATELLVALTREAGRSLRGQLEDRLRTGIRSGILGPGSPLPSSRTLARDLGVSRGVVVEVYEQLTAEGYLQAHVGSGTTVAAIAPLTPASAAGVTDAPHYRYDFRPGVPEYSLFPRTAWMAALRSVLRTMPDAMLGYGDARGAPELRAALSAYLARVRGVATSPHETVVCSGFAQGLGLVCQILRTTGHHTLAIEDPSHPGQRALIAGAGLDIVPIRVDTDGLCVDALAATEARAVLVTPAHEFPAGVVLSPERRAQLINWARERDALIIEDDYDAEYRYDRAPVGALQGLAPERVIYGGSASKMLAPALRLGWLVAPAALAQTLAHAKRYADLGSPVLDQLAFAHLLESGGLDRHLRKARVVYRARRDALIAALKHAIPAAQVHGIAAGLHALVELPAGLDEATVVAAAAERGVGVYGLSTYCCDPTAHPAGLVVGYAALTERDIVAGIAALSRAVADCR